EGPGASGGGGHGGAHVFPEAHPPDVAALHFENPDEQPIFAAQGDRSGIHDSEVVVQELVVGDALEHGGARVALGVAVVDAFYLGRLENSVGANFHRPKSGGGVGRKIRVSGSGREDHDVAALEVTDGASANVGLGNLANLDGGHHARGDARAFERILQC